MGHEVRPLLHGCLVRVKDNDRLARRKLEEMTDEEIGISQSTPSAQMAVD